MKTLIYVPVIHSSADLGSLAKEVTKRGIAGLGEDFWKKHTKTVDGFWNAVSHYFSSIEISGMKIYQDGMIVDGEVGQKIVEEGVKAGSKNYKLVSRLLKRGAILVKTEDFKLVKEERDRLLTITQAKSIAQKFFAFIKYKLTQNRLLNTRDAFITKRIDETLDHSETGILFIGAYHNIKNKLPKSIHAREIKNTEKVREYQQLLPFYNKNKRHFEELARYLISPINLEGYKL